MPAYNLDRKLTATMVEDFIFDPIMAAKVILRIKVPPHEELRILRMWTDYYTIDDSGFSTGKSFTIAIVSALRSVLFPNRISGILSKTFAQGKLIFKNYEKWAATCPIFKNCLTHQKGQPRLLHGQEAFEAYFRGFSTIRVLPPSFAQDAERLRSERWNDGYFDEWTTYGKFEAFNSTIIGRVTKENDYQDCPVRQNHVHLFSTPQFEHHPAFKIVRSVNNNIAAGSHDYSRFTCNYRAVPKTKEWRWLINRKVIFTMQTTLPQGIVNSEINGLWQKDSMSYYSAYAMQRVRNIRFAIMRRTVHEELFVAGYDTARGNENSRKSGDDFSITVLRLENLRSRPQHCLTVRRNNIKSKQMSGIIHDIHRNLHLSCLVFDPGGGGIFVKDELREQKQLIRDIPIVCTPIIEQTDTSGAIGDMILHRFGRGDMIVEQQWGKMQSDSILINRMHRAMKGAIESGDIELAEDWNGWEHVSAAQWDVDAKREYLNKVTGLTEKSRALAEMSVAVDQLVMVDILRNDAGEPLLDKFGMYKFKSKLKKDSAYSLCYAYTAYLLLLKMQEMGLESGGREQADNSFYVSLSPV